MLVEGAILDDEGPRRAYVRVRHGEVVEVGLPGTDSTRGRERRVRGIVIPPPVNGHTHLGDSVSVREPPPGPIAALVRPPNGYKFRLLAEATADEKRRGLRGALRRMRHDHVAATVDFREEGIPGVRMLRAAARAEGIRAIILGRPLARPVDPRELAELLRVADGVGLSSALEESRATRDTVARACRRAGRHFGLHASESRREDPDDFLRPRPDLLVHLSHATDDDLATVHSAGVTVAVCPRSNALFGRQPDLAAMERLGMDVLLGTDNAMFHAPSIWRELEFAYVGSRLTRHPVSAAFLARCALVTPWRWLGEPGVAHVGPGMPRGPLLVRLPPDDPAYQLVTRTSEHLIVPLGPEGRRGGAGR